MRRVFGLLAFLVLSLCGIASAQAAMDVKVDIAAQRMTVTTSDGEVHHWAVSSGRKGFRSPNGVYRPTRLEKSWYSRKYGGAMPHAVFFRGGYAIHGTSSIAALGRPASHGCIRLHPANAAKFFALVKKHGVAQTRIALNGAAPDNLSRFARAGERGKVKLARSRSQAPVLAATPRGEARIAGADLGPAKIAKVKAKRQNAIGAAGQPRGEAGWDAARGQILLRPALPAGAYGYQPYGPPGYGYGSGWR